MDVASGHEPTATELAAGLLRRRWWLWTLLVLAVTAAVIAAVESRQETRYKSEALIVATELTIRVDAFPRTATAIFEGGTVAEIVAERAGTGIDPDDLIPDILDVQPVEGTAVAEVDAVHANPELAALYANLAADALVEELNRVGPGLGTFAVHARARVPDSPLTESILPAAVGGFVAGLALVAGLVGLLAVITAWRWKRRGGPVTAVSGIGTAYQQRLTEAGVRGLVDLALADAEWLAITMEIRPELASDWIGQARTILTARSNGARPIRPASESAPPGRHAG